MNLNRQKWLQVQTYRFSPLTVEDSPQHGDRVLINYGNYIGFIGYIDAWKHDSWYTVTIPLSDVTGETAKGFFDLSHGRGELSRAEKLFD
jgi:hypothetical protein